MNRIKKLTLPLFAACLCAALIGCSEDKKETKSAAPASQEQAVQQPVEQAKQAAEATTQAVGEAAEQAAEATKEAADKAAETTAEAVDKAAEVTGEAAKAVDTNAEKAMDKAHKKLEGC